MLNTSGPLFNHLTLLLCRDRIKNVRSSETTLCTHEWPYIHGYPAKEIPDSSLKGKEGAMSEAKVGYVKDYFAKVGVAAIELTDGRLAVGDTIHIKGHTTELIQRVDSIQLEHQALEHAEPGQLIGIKVRERVRQHDQVFKVTE